MIVNFGAEIVNNLIDKWIDRKLIFNIYSYLSGKNTKYLQVQARQVCVCVVGGGFCCF